MAAVGAVLGVIVFFLALVTVWFSEGTDREVLFAVSGAELVVGLFLGLLCRARKVSRRGVWLTGGSAGGFAGAVVALCAVGLAASYWGRGDTSGAIRDLGVAGLVFALVSVFVTIGTVGVGWRWRGISDSAPGSGWSGHLNLPVMLAGGALGSVAFFPTVLSGLWASALFMPGGDSVTWTSALILVSGAEFAVGLLVGLLCRTRRLSYRGLWLTAGLAGVLVGVIPRRASWVSSPVISQTALPVVRSVISR